VRLGFSSGGGLAGALSAIAGALGAGGTGDDGLEPVFDGYITTVTLTLGSHPGDSHVEVAAMDTSVLLSLEEKIATWPNMSDSDIVRQIVAAYGVAVDADSTSAVHQENDTTIVQRSTDFQFVRDLATLNGFEFYFDTDKASSAVTAHFRAPRLDAAPQPDLAIQFGEDSNLRSFSACLNMQRPLAVKLQQIDIKTNGANSAQATQVQLAKLGDKDSNTLFSGPLASLVTPKDTQGQMLALGPPTSDPTELQTISQAARDEAGWFITAEGEINTDAYQSVLRPHRLVLIKGSGTPFSGKYYVTRVVHELAGGGAYKQTFEARRNARDLDGTETFGSGGGLGLPVPGL
jgi:phage protein D